MTKRRVNHQQQARIEKKQQKFQQRDALINLKSTEEGIVIARYAKHAQIQTTDARRIRCSIRPNIDSLVAGDYIVWQAEGDHQGVVISRYPRHSVLGRPNKRGEVKAVAANITQVMIVIAIKPAITWPLLDSYLVLSEHLNVQACIVLNKVDLPCQTLRDQLIQEYQSIGYPIIFTSEADKNSTHYLKKQLDNQVSVFVGQSGVGKSSLIARILPDELNIQTAALSENSELGCHTTSNSYFYYLPTGGAIIDSPGVREFGLWNMSADLIAKGYREFSPFLSHCKFRNCNHINAPGCALKSAVSDGLISKKRYESFLKVSDHFGK